MCACVCVCVSVCEHVVSLHRFPVALRDVLSSVRKSGAETMSLPVTSGRSEEVEESGLQTVELVPVRLEGWCTYTSQACCHGNISLHTAHTQTPTL